MTTLAEQAPKRVGEQTQGPRTRDFVPPPFIVREVFQPADVLPLFKGFRQPQGELPYANVVEAAVSSLPSSIADETRATVKHMILNTALAAAMQPDHIITRTAQELDARRPEGEEKLYDPASVNRYDITRSVTTNANASEGPESAMAHLRRDVAVEVVQTKLKDYLTRTQNNLSEETTAEILNTATVMTNTVVEELHEINIIEMISDRKEESAANVIFEGSLTGGKLRAREANTPKKYS